MYIYGIQKNGIHKPISRAEIETRREEAYGNGGEREGMMN